MGGAFAAGGATRTPAPEMPRPCYIPADMSHESRRRRVESGHELLPDEPAAGGRRVDARRAPADTAPLRALGPLETRVLECLWSRPAAQVVSDLRDGFPGVAYTTLMTTLDRLYKKGLLDRERRGRAFAYRPRYTRAGLRERLARGTIDRLLGAERHVEALVPILSTFVQEVGRRDDGLLDALEDLIRERRGKEKR